MPHSTEDMASELPEEKHKKILDENRSYLVEHIDAKDTLLWDKLIEKKVFSVGDANKIKVSPKVRRTVL